MSKWPDNLAVVGKITPRVEGPSKVSGAAKYTSDVQPPGWLYGMILRSKFPAGTVTAINLDAARNMPGVKAVMLVKDLPITVHYYGEELAAVAAVSQDACRDALRAIRVESTPTPFVVDPALAAKPGAPAVNAGDNNLSPPRVKEVGNAGQGFAQATAQVEGYFSTQTQLHHALETHGNTVAAQTDDVTVWCSTQGIFSVRDGIAGNLNKPHNQVTAICDHMGGGFGAKFGPGVEGMLAAKLSQQAGAPVRIMLTRLDESLAVGNRPCTYQKIKMGATADGKLVAFQMDAFGSAGFASGGKTAGGGGGAGFPSPYIYSVPNVRVKQSDVGINAGSARAFRAPGSPQASFGMESIMDELAAKLGMDPVDFRLANDPHPIRRRQWKLAAERFGWREKRRAAGGSSGPIKTGVGCAAAAWGGGGSGTQAQVEISPDGTVEVRCGTQDIGSGTRTIVTMVASEIFGLEPHQIVARIGDTRYPPSGGSGGSTTAASVSPAIFNTCTNALAELQKVSGMPDVRGPNWKAACAKLGTNPISVDGKWEEGLSSSGVAGVQMAEVEVDVETGFVHVKKVLCVQDCGLVVHPLTCASQVNGGVIMGIGYALYEERVLDNLTGVILNGNFERYRLTGVADIPEIDVVLINLPERGVIGVAEPVTIPTAAAVANAVANAIGVRVGSLPITPAKVLAALGKVPNRKPEDEYAPWQPVVSLVRSAPAHGDLIDPGAEGEETA